MDEERQYILGLDEYVRQGEPQKQERGRAWQTAIGLQEVDGLTPSPYLLATARRHIDGDLQSANPAFPLPPKCKNCTLEEIAVLRVIQQRPSATQKSIASEIGKSERTVKTITSRLAERGLLTRKNGKRNGYWEINNE